MRALLYPLLLATALSAPAAANDQREARLGVAQGRYVPLETVIRDALRRQPGQLLEAELDEGEYEIEILRADGLVAELDYDARTGTLLKMELDED